MRGLQQGFGPEAVQERPVRRAVQDSVEAPPDVVEKHDFGIRILVAAVVVLHDVVPVDGEAPVLSVPVVVQVGEVAFRKSVVQIIYFCK